MDKTDAEIQHIGMMDQAHSGLKDIAQTQLDYWQAMRHGGMTRAEALTASNVYLRELFGLAKKGGE